MAQGTATSITGHHPLGDHLGGTAAIKSMAHCVLTCFSCPVTANLALRWSDSVNCCPVCVAWSSWMVEREKGRTVAWRRQEDASLELSSRVRDISCRSESSKYKL